MGETILVCYAISVHILVRIRTETNHIFLSEYLQDRIDLTHLKSYALFMQSDGYLSDLVIEAIDAEIKMETVWF